MGREKSPGLGNQHNESHDRSGAFGLVPHPKIQHNIAETPDQPPPKLVVPGEIRALYNRKGHFTTGNILHYRGAVLWLHRSVL